MQRAALIFALFALAAVASAQTWGLVRIVPSKGNSGISGTATFSTSGTTTSVTINVGGIPANLPRMLGVHLHEFADMGTLADVNGFEPGNKTFGSHWIGAGNATFGCPENNTFPGFRAGCLGNWMVSNDGFINQTKTFNWVQISAGNAAVGDIAYPQSSPIGLGLLIHANTDPCNGTSTLYGARIAGGVIGMVSSAPANARYYANPAANTITAVCRIIGTNGNSSNADIRGTVWFRQTSASSVIVRARITNVPGGLGNQGARSMHVHAWGDLSDQAAGAATGGHWNPLNNPHALPPQEPRHQGDMGRVTVINATGASNELFYYTVLSSSDPSTILKINHPQLSGEYSILGRGLIFHAGQDIGCRGATNNGDAGGRIGQCVIGKARDEVWEEMVANWASTAPSNIQSPQVQPGDICTAPTNPLPPTSSATSAIASVAVALLAAVAALLL